MLMKKKKTHIFTKSLLALLADETGCDIQHNGCPCNTCFHFFGEDSLKLSPEMTHKLWEIVLVLRVDYTEKDITKHPK